MQILYQAKSRISSTKIFLDNNHKHFYNLHYVEISDLVTRKFDLNEGDCLIWHYYDDKKAAIVRKREGWKSRVKHKNEKSTLPPLSYEPDR